MFVKINSWREFDIYCVDRFLINGCILLYLIFSFSTNILSADINDIILKYTNTNYKDNIIIYDNIIDYKPPYPISPIPLEEEFNRIAMAAEYGDAESQLYMGVFYANGNNVKQDYRIAAEWFRKAAMQGNSIAMRNLALLYDCGVGIERDYFQAVLWYKKAARQLESAAYMGLAKFPLTFSEKFLPIDSGSCNLFRLIAFYLNDTFISSSTPEADFWRQYYAKLPFYLDDSKLAHNVHIKAIKGDSEAKLQMAVFYFLGQGVDVSKENFIRWLESAAKTNTRAKFILYADANNFNKFPMLPVYNTNDYFWKRRNVLKVIADNGVDCYYSFQYIYTTKFTEQFPVIPDEIIKMAKNGYFPAVLAAHSLEYNNRRNRLSSQDWFEIAKVNAIKGRIYSMVLMAYFSLYGIECTQNMDEAYHWIRSLIDSSDVRGLIKLGEILSENTKDASAITTDIISYFTAKANNNERDAYIFLGIYHASSKRYDDAAAWYKKAIADHNSPEAMFFLGLLPKKYHYIEGDMRFDENHTKNYNYIEKNYALLFHSAKLRYIPSCLKLLFTIEWRAINRKIICDPEVKQELFRIILTSERLRNVAFDKTFTLEKVLQRIFMKKTKNVLIFGSPIPDYYPYIPDPLNGG